MAEYGSSWQIALIEALTGATELSRRVERRIYDEPPSGATLPYIRLGGIQPRPMRAQDMRAARITYSIEVHSRPERSGRVEATTIAEAVVAALDEKEERLRPQGLRTSENTWITTTVERGSDGRSYTATVAFQAIVSG